MSEHRTASIGRADHNEPPTRPVCAHCADVIGAYEPIWIQLTDGSLHQSSLLNLANDTRAGQSVAGIWHAGCLAGDAIARSHEA